METEYTNETQSGPIGQKIFQIETYGFSELDGDCVETETVQGYLAVTPDFAAVTDDVGRVVYYVPANHIKRIFATGDAPVPEKPVIDLSNVVAIGSAN